MSPSPDINKVIAALNKKDLSTADKSLLISAVLTKLAAIPLRDILYVSESRKLFVNGKEVSIEKANQLRGSAMMAMRSEAFKLIREQVVYATFVQAAHGSVSTEDLMFGKAALWWGQQEDKYFKMLTDEDRDGNSSLEGD